MVRRAHRPRSPPLARSFDMKSRIDVGAEEANKRRCSGRGRRVGWRAQARRLPPSSLHLGSSSSSALLVLTGRDLAKARTHLEREVAAPGAGREERRCVWVGAAEAREDCGARCGGREVGSASRRGVGGEAARARHRERRKRAPSAPPRPSPAALSPARAVLSSPGAAPPPSRRARLCHRPSAAYSALSPAPPPSACAHLRKGGRGG